MALEGRIVIEKALECGIEILGLLRSPESGNQWLEAYSEKFPIVTMNHAELCALAGFKFHHGALALGRRPELRNASGLWPTHEQPTLPTSGSALERHRPPYPRSPYSLRGGPGARGVLSRRWLRRSLLPQSLARLMGNAFSLPLYACDQTALRTLASGVSTGSRDALGESPAPARRGIDERRARRRNFDASPYPHSRQRGVRLTGRNHRSLLAGNLHTHEQRRRFAQRGRGGKYLPLLPYSSVTMTAIIFSGTAPVASMLWEAPPPVTTISPGFTSIGAPLSFTRAVPSRII